MTLRTHLDGTVFVEHVTGRAPCILALHGWRRDRSDLLVALRGREVVAVDLPGFGSSPEPPEPWGAAAYADAVAKLTLEIEGGPFLVVGHSFGGRVAVHLAARHPELVSGIVLAGVPLLRTSSKPKSPLVYRGVRTARRMHLVPDRALEAMRRRYGSDDYRAATGRMRDVLVRVVNEDYREQLGQIECPVGLCWGADDTSAPAAVASEAAELVTRLVRLDIVQGVGHDVHHERPEALDAVIDSVASEII